MGSYVRCIKGEELKIENIYYLSIKNKNWMIHNLDVCKFRNGEPILKAQSLDEWRNAGRNKIAAYCEAFNINYYNWYAASDHRGLAPLGWHIPTIEEMKWFLWHLNYYKTIGLIQGIRGRYDSWTKEGGFYCDGPTMGSWWTSEIINGYPMSGYFHEAHEYEKSREIKGENPEYGLTVICVQDY
jgi:uncharacterized protein (TIGR02145 family)